MKTNKELVEHLNSLQILQTHSWNKCIPKEIWNDYFEDKCEEIELGLDVDKHRWYELTTTVLQINNGFISVRSITDMFSEQSSFEDMYHHLEFFEMEEILIKSYKKQIK